MIFLFVYYFKSSKKRNFSIREILYSEGSIPKVLDIHTEEDDISNDTNKYRIALLRCRFSSNSSRKSDGKDAHRVRRMAFDSYGEFHQSLAPSPCVPSKQCNTIYSDAFVLKFISDFISRWEIRITTHRLTTSASL